MASKRAATLKQLGLPEVAPTKLSETVIKPRASRSGGGESEVRFINQLPHPVELFWIDTGGKRHSYGSMKPGATLVQHSYAGHVWLACGPKGEELGVIEVGSQPQRIILDARGKAPSPQKRPGLSPDGEWQARIKGRSIFIYNAGDELVHEIQCEHELHGRAQWSPDSAAFIVSMSVTVKPRQVHIVESTPKGQLQPKLTTLDYVKPGDPLPKPQLILCRTDGRHHIISTELYPTPFTQEHSLKVSWAPDSTECYLNYNQRGHQLYRVLAVNKQSAAVRVIVEERSKTFIDYTAKTWRHWLHSTGELLWMSERSGWAHLWMVDVKQGKVKHPITTGSWVVRSVEHVDEKVRQIWLMASGLKPGEDPYHRHLCRVGFDGKGFTQLTTGDGDHSVSFSPDRSCFVDAWSRADAAPIHELRSAVDGSLICELEKADITQLLATGWTLPERFVAKGRDGQTDIHGVIVRPRGFDPGKKYPVVEYIYAGPHGSFAPKRFGSLGIHCSVAELGCIVVQLDGMGTNHRGKAFHDVCWKALDDGGFPDRKLWIATAARTRPWMDLSRVGIFGGSAGGQSAMRALIDHPDFYHVAVADCGCHDNRMDKIWWNEQWLGWPVDESYDKSSNLTNAHKLQGQLLLIVGELDSNVDPATTAQIVGALQKAKKSFEFMPIIGAGHGAAETEYGRRLRLQFFTKHLLGMTTGE
jgi:dipeptidyl-peptidase 4